MGKVIVTGGAGFIGSCIIRMLNDKGIEDIVVVDNIAETEKWRNLRNKEYMEYIHKNDFLNRLHDFRNENISHVIHMGACSSTTEKNFDYLYTNNFEYSKKLWDFCVENGSNFIYASSAATYGDGSLGFNDEGDIKKLRPLNGYGYSKQLFDLWTAKQEKKPKQYVGFKFFNVYGPNEYHKGSMASVIFHSFNQIQTSGKVNLFKSYNSKYEDGGQMRDFVYVKDICKVVSFMMENENISGLFNLGTGQARTFYDLAHGTFKALDLKPEIQFIEMPETLRAKYQYYTEANMDKLRKVGYKEAFCTLEEGILDYARNFLAKEMEVY